MEMEKLCFFFFFLSVSPLFTDNDVFSSLFTLSSVRIATESCFYFSALHIYIIKHEQTSIHRFAQTTARDAPISPLN